VNFRIFQSDHLQLAVMPKCHRSINGEIIILVDERKHGVTARGSAAIAIASAITTCGHRAGSIRALSLQDDPPHSAVQSCGPTDLDDENDGRDGIAKKQEQERFLEPD